MKQNTHPPSGKAQKFVYPPLFMTGWELPRVLRDIGIPVREFARTLGRSENYIRQSLGYRMYESIPIKVMQALQELAVMSRLTRRW